VRSKVSCTFFSSSKKKNKDYNNVGCEFWQLTILESLICVKQESAKGVRIRKSTIKYFKTERVYVKYFIHYIEAMY
jgi:hypothetical protein